MAARPRDFSSCGRLTAQYAGFAPIFRAISPVASKPSAAGNLQAICRASYQAHPAKYLELLSSHAPVERVWAGPAFMSTRDLPPSAPPIAISGHNAHLLRDGFDDWMPDVAHRHPFMAVIENDQALSICASVRISDAVHCAGVQTRADHRRRGHAVDAVAGWARAVRSLGAAPFYSTSWDNVASQGVAHRLQLSLVGVDFHLT